MKKTMISAFILFNFLIMARIHLPLDTKFFSGLYRPVDSYLSFFSIYQDWMMFAPNPSKLNMHLTAEVEFMDGSRATYSFPNSSDLSLIDKYIYGERYRKIVSEAIRRDSHSFMWKDTAKFALRKLRDTHSDRIPAKVHLTRHWDEVPPMEVRFRPHGTKTQSFQSYKFYTYEVI